MCMCVRVHVRAEINACICREDIREVKQQTVGDDDDFTQVQGV